MKGKLVKPLNISFINKFTMTTRKYVNVEGEEFGLRHLYGTLCGITNCDYWYDGVPDKRMANHFAKIKVTKPSRSWVKGSSEGPCFRDLFDRVKKEYCKNISSGLFI